MTDNQLLDAIDLMLGDVNVDSDETAELQAIKDFYLYESNN